MPDRLDLNFAINASLVMHGAPGFEVGFLDAVRHFGAKDFGQIVFWE